MTILVQQQLRESALKATPGPWQHERLGIIQGGPMQTYVNGAAMPQLFTSQGADFMSPGEYLANADFVAAANPTAVLALLDELDQLKTENAELRKDKDRLDHGYIMTGTPGVDACEHRGMDLRASIDRVTQLDEQRVQRQAMTKEGL